MTFERLYGPQGPTYQLVIGRRLCLTLQAPWRERSTISRSTIYHFGHVALEVTDKRSANLNPLNPLRRTRW